VTPNRRVALYVGGAVALAAVALAAQLATHPGDVPTKTSLSRSAAQPTRESNHASAPASAAVARCKAADLRVSYVQVPEGMLIWSTNFTLTNAGASACSLVGYPELDFKLASGATATAALTDATAAPYDPVNAGVRDSIPETEIGIAPGAPAYFYVASTTRSDGPCDLTQKFTVTIRVPGDPGPGAALADFTPASCGATIEGMVSPFTPVPPSS
jgi:hypothetical protein